MFNTTNIDLQAVQSLKRKYAAHSDLQIMEDRLEQLERAKTSVLFDQRQQASILAQLTKEEEKLHERLRVIEAQLGIRSPTGTLSKRKDRASEPAPSGEASERAPSGEVLTAPAMLNNLEIRADDKAANLYGQDDDGDGIALATNADLSPPTALADPQSPDVQMDSQTPMMKPQLKDKGVPMPSQSASKPEELKEPRESKKPKQPKEPKFKFRGPADIRLTKLQKWFSQELPKPLAEWTGRQKEQHESALKMMWAPTDENATVEWILGEGCVNNNAPNCKTVCKDKGLVCNKKLLDSLTTEESIKHAAASAGWACGVLKALPNVGTWDGPWINGDTCGYATGHSFGDCEKSTNCGFKRICPCTGIAPEMQVKLPSVKRQKMMRWHQQWDRKCDAEEMEKIAQSGERPKIPRHFHFTVIEDRSNWINWSFPYQLIDAGSPIYKRLTQEEQLLIENMRYSLIKNDAFSVHFLDTMACISACRQMSKGLLRLYLAEGDLRYKSDICRVAALYLEGGYYFDDDMLSYRPVIPLIKDDTEFATAKSISDALYFQSFMASTPCNPIMKRNAEMLEEARQPKPHPKYDGLLGPRTLKLAMDEVTQSGQVKKSHTQLFQESSYNPGDSRYEKVPDRGGHQCGLVVYDPATKKTPFCSRF